jgi:tRNA(Ile)-lysidine synthase
MRVFRPPLWVRPLLQIPRRDLLAEAIGCGIPYVEDSTNRSLDRRRNLLRHELLPWIRASLNPRVDEHLTGLAESMRFARDYLEEVAGGLIESARSGPGRFRVAPLREAPPAVRRAALQLMFGAAAGSGAALRRPQLRTVEHLVLTDGPLRRTPLPRGVTAVRAGERLRWVRND